MSKQSKQPAVPSFIESHWSDHPLGEWISNNRQFILWFIAGLFVLLIVAARLLMGRNSNAESDYIKAQTVFNQFQEAAINPDRFANGSDSLNDLETIIKQYPELHAKYDAALAQTLIIEDQITKAEIFAKATFRRTKNDHIKNYHAFANTSLLISAGDYPKALLKSQQLQEVLRTDLQRNDVSVLYLYNLLRLATLHQELGNLQEEANNWEEFQQITPQPNVSALLNLFTQGNANLNQYIQKRKT